MKHYRYRFGTVKWAMPVSTKGVSFPFPPNNDKIINNKNNINYGIILNGQV